MQADIKMSKTFKVVIFLLTSLIQLNSLTCRTAAYFSPDDKVASRLIGRFNRCKNRIYAAIYMLTNKKIAVSLVEAHKRGIDVQIVTDEISVESNYGKINFLKENGIKTYTFKKSRPEQKNMNEIMHNKFAIIDNGVWTGSFNWTVSADQRNQENAIWTDAKSICRKFLAQFKKLKSRCF